jgi:hypothetical protein
LTVVAAVFLVSAVQYMLWRRLRLQLDGDPYFGGDIGFGRYGEKDQPFYESFGIDAEFQTLKSKARPQEIRVYTSAAIGSADVLQNGTTGVELFRVKRDCLVCRPSGALPKGTTFSLRIGSRQPIKLVRVLMLPSGSSEEY